MGKGAIRPIVPVLLKLNGKHVPTYALFDSGANCSALTSKLAKDLNVPHEYMDINLNTFDKSVKSKRAFTSFKVSNLNNTFEMDIERAIIGDLLGTGTEVPPSSEELKGYKHLENLEINELEDKTIGLLIDAKYAYAFSTGKNLIGKKDEPIAWGTQFGPAIIGPRIPLNPPDDPYDDLYDENINEVDITEEIACLNIEEISIPELINRAFRMDFICRDFELYPQEVVHKSVDDEKSLEIMKKSAKFVKEEGRWKVAMPWILGRQATADLFRKIGFLNMTMERHYKLGKKFELNPELKKGSFKQMQMTLEEGHARIIPNLEAPKEAPVCYLPNHIVTKPDKPGKFRICQDAAAKVGKHFLNRYLFGGPDLLNNLITVILNFRKEKYTMSADITNFFYMILLEEHDRPSLRYPWWKDETLKEIIMLESPRHMFGITSSPTISNFILKAHAEMEKSNMSEETYLALLYAFYVDDLLKSIKDIPTARLIKEEITRILAKGGFTICKWKSNIPEINDNFSPTPPQTQHRRTSPGALVNRSLHNPQSLPTKWR